MVPFAISDVCRRMCRTLRAGMRQYGLFRYFNRVLPCGLGYGQVVEKMVSAVGIEPTTY